MVKKFRFSFHELNTLPGEIEELMGFEPGRSPEPFPGLIAEGLHKASALCRLEGGFKIFETLKTDLTRETIHVSNVEFLAGRIVVNQLKDATSAALFICTAGAGITDYAKQKALEGEVLESYVLDVIGSVAADKAAEKIQDEIFMLVKGSGQGITDPFSPGYCSWNVADQHKLFGLLPSRFCEISLSDTSLMEPIKSVSGITGIGQHCERSGYQCKWCNDRDCIYGKIRRRKKG